MQSYLLQVWQVDGMVPPTEAELAEIMKGVGAWEAELQAAGSWVFGGGLHGPEASTVLQAGAGDVLTTDGPFVEGKEHIAGFSVIQVEDLDAALDWAKKFIRVTGLPLEVRPVITR